MTSVSASAEPEENRQGLYAFLISCVCDGCVLPVDSVAASEAITSSPADVPARWRRVLQGWSGAGAETFAEA